MLRMSERKVIHGDVEQRHYKKEMKRHSEVQENEERLEKNIRGRKKGTMIFYLKITIDKKMCQLGDFWISFYENNDSN